MITRPKKQWHLLQAGSWGTSIQAWRLYANKTGYERSERLYHLFRTAVYENGRALALCLVEKERGVFYRVTEM